MERMEIANTGVVLDVNNACLDGSRFVCVGAQRLYMENVSLANTKITDANLSDLEIDGAQLGGAYIHKSACRPKAIRRTSRMRGRGLLSSRTVCCRTARSSTAIFPMWKSSTARSVD